MNFDTKIKKYFNFCVLVSSQYVFTYIQILGKTIKIIFNYGIPNNSWLPKTTLMNGELQFHAVNMTDKLQD